MTPAPSELYAATDAEGQPLQAAPCGTLSRNPVALGACLALRLMDEEARDRRRQCGRLSTYAVALYVAGVMSQPEEVDDAN